MFAGSHLALERAGAGSPAGHRAHTLVAGDPRADVVGSGGNNSFLGKASLSERAVAATTRITTRAQPLALAGSRRALGVGQLPRSAVSFGYHTRPGGVGRSLVTHDSYPQCLNGQDALEVRGKRCSNTLLLRARGIRLDQGQPHYDSALIPGATQLATGIAQASQVPSTATASSRQGARRGVRERLGKHRAQLAAHGN